MNAKQLLEQLLEFQRQGIDLGALDVVTVYRSYVSAIEYDIEQWAEVYPDEVDADVEHSELRLVS